MPDPETFLVPYPCYFPLTEGGDRLITVTVDDMPAVVFLTDMDLAAHFCQEWSTGNSSKTKKFLQFDDRTALLATIRQIDKRTSAAGIRHLAIDPGGRYQRAYVTIEDFLAYVEGLLAGGAQRSLH
jgi:hypothetical protein